MSRAFKAKLMMYGIIIGLVVVAVAGVKARHDRSPQPAPTSKLTPVPDSTRFRHSTAK